MTGSLTTIEETPLSGMGMAYGIDNKFTEDYDMSKVNTRTLNDEEKKVMRCVAFIRVSTNKDEQKDSLVNQKQMYIDTIKKNGWELSDFYYEIESGRYSDRDEIKRFLNDLKENKFDVLLTKEISRISRNSSLSYLIRDSISEKQLHWVSLDNSINTLIGNTQMFGLHVWMHENESRTTGERIKSVLDMKAKNGEFNGSNPPYGYTVKDKKLFINDDETPLIVRRIYREYLAGNGHDAIARGLYNESIPTPSMKQARKNASDEWHGSSIRIILENPHYTGSLVQSRTKSVSITSRKRVAKNPDEMIIVKDTHEAIISQTDFDLVQKIIQSRKRIRPQANTRLFSNIIYCADCGRAMHYKKVTT
ncbi:recombinase family protein [Sporosarcina limicola]|uniref:DNA invertase Pin-like site-specific DNA recombinase n=1 Tax=Sporosarcina limicola TaxID=34101 RepID=A0A927MMU0_9BACL|nr:recombinase family protein [Sporosarcina limicola]MBE1556012.1 DNA invertase Pin-like site-specific DNA recombinase [Sporosarcina limicola]